MAALVGVEGDLPAAGSLVELFSEDAPFFFDVVELALQPIVDRGGDHHDDELQRHGQHGWPDCSHVAAFPSSIPSRIRGRISATTFWTARDTGPDPGLTALRFDLRPVAFRIPDRVGSSIHDFRGSTSPPVYPLSTLRSRPHGRTTQDSLPAGGTLPWPVGLSPMGRDRKFQLATSAFPFSRLLLAQPKTRRRGSPWPCGGRCSAIRRGRSLASDRSSCLMVDADYSENVFLALVVDPIRRDRPAPYDCTRTKPTLRTFEVSLRQTTYELSDIPVELGCHGRITATEKLQCRQKILLGLRSKDDLQRRRLSSMR